jgi:hypothetical protein
MSDKTGGAAFPETTVVIPESFRDVNYGREGMTLRDYFAAKGMPIVHKSLNYLDFNETNVKDFARCAYMMADAMIAEREKP